MNVAKLKYEIDSSQTKTAKKNLDGMTRASKDAKVAQSGLAATSTRAGRDITAANTNVARSGALVTKAYSAMKLAMIAALAVMTAALTRFITSSIGAASDLNETISKTATIFGNGTGAMLEWASTSATAMGLSKNAALETAATMGMMFTQLGSGTKQAGEISRSMIQLAADIASFNNVAGGAAEVSNAMQSAFRGEYDSLQRYIPTINAAAVQLEALRMTGKANEKQLTALDKALAAQKIIMEGAGTAAGDFARTSEQLANQQRILAANMTDLSAAFGAFFTPVATAAVQSLNTAFAFLRDNIDTISVAAGTAGTLMLIAFGPAILAGMAAGFAALGAAGVTAINLITAAMMANPLGALAVGIVTAVTALYVFRDEVKKAIGVDVVAVAKFAANTLIGAFVAAFEDIKFVWSNFGNIMGAAVVGGVNIAISAINTLVNGAKRSINDVIALANMIPGVDIGVLDVSGSAISAIGNSYADALGGAVGDRNKAVADAMSFDYIGAIGNTFKESTPDVHAFNAAVGEVEQSATAAGGALKSAATDAKDPWAGLRGAVDKAKESLDFAKDATKGFLSDLRTGLMNGEGFFKSFGNAALNVLDKIINKIEDQLVEALFSLNSTGGSSGGGLFGSILGGIGKLFGFAKGTNYAPGGVAMVGEEGPELVELPRGSKVNTANETRRMMNPANQNGGGGSSDVVTITLRDDSGRMASIADQQIQTRSGTIVQVAVEQSRAQIMPTVAEYQGNRAGSDYRTT